MRQNVFDTKASKVKRKRNILRVKSGKKHIPTKREPSERYKDILNYYKNERKTNKFIDKRKNKEGHKNSARFKKGNIFNLNNDSFLKDKHISTNDVYGEGDYSDDSSLDSGENWSGGGSRKGKRKSDAMVNNFVQEKIEKKKLWKIKKYEIKEKLREIDKHFEVIKNSVLSLPGTTGGVKQNVDLERGVAQAFTKARSHNGEIKKLGLGVARKEEQKRDPLVNANERGKKRTESDEKGANRKRKVQMEMDGAEEEDNDEEDEEEDAEEVDDEEVDEEELNEEEKVDEEENAGDDEDEVDGWEVEDESELEDGLVIESGWEAKDESEEDSQNEQHGDGNASEGSTEQGANESIQREEDTSKSQLLGHKTNESGEELKESKFSIYKKKKKTEESDNQKEYSVWCLSDDSDNETIDQLFREKKKLPFIDETVVSISKEKMSRMLEKFLLNGNKELCSYFSNESGDEKGENLPAYISIEKKQYQLEHVIALLDSHNFSAQKKMLYRVYHLNMFNKKKEKSIPHSSFFFSLMDYCILKIYRCFKYGLSVQNFIENYKDIIVDFCHPMKTELYLYMSFLLLIIFCKIQGKGKANLFYRKKRDTLAEYVESNKGAHGKAYDVHIYSRILKSADLFSDILEEYQPHLSGDRAADEGIISYVHFAVILLALIIYPIEGIESNRQSQTGKGNERSRFEKDGADTLGENISIEHLLTDINKNRVEDEKLFHKFAHLKGENLLSEKEERIPLMGYLIELVEYIFYKYFHSINANLSLGEDEGGYQDMCSRDTYTSASSMEECIQNIERAFSFKRFEMVDVVKSNKKNQTDAQSNTRADVKSDLGIFSKKKQLKKAIILLNIYNIFLDNSKKYSQSFFYLSFKILNTLLYGIIHNRRGKLQMERDSKGERNYSDEKILVQEKDHYYELSFNTFKNVILFLKAYLDKQFNAYILINHIVRPCLLFLFVNFLSYIKKVDGEVNLTKIVEDFGSVQVRDDYLVAADSPFVKYQGKEEKYFLFLLYTYKLMDHSSTYEITPIVSHNLQHSGIQMFTPKYANSRNPKDFLIMQSGQAKFAEMKAQRKKMKQQKKLDYNELKKENNYLLALKAKEEQERVRRNREKYKKVKLMAKKDVEEYNKMKTYTH
ncbi:conserved Plasmodium protein, unknown function [Plasmodium knowlesi strain H]|uniref:Uncharacterized protein n=3 Tax=Plasmodium knowlesi TaxID=5850 RepID=A0A5K1VPC1_PLAKH|nr:conserved Plasmodium protein, unknown function [Plasmodium knowlesi strain H]OTN65113.1 Uncharacterized protein PKNOH_S120149900 [Plasmodium knowlesi]CAA9988356.1 conserved Plasmodium protein, unknown function [Plasmodium knowlesi strain H]SBO20059.1 conserved Plasmodium protein, unknown function [Plasmodium knowlesi strain H]SBO20314.1 conserved Plasmodium protein, unknown function [Plasmodium knowlesi strain H]VVS77830.1 conserved Plasmodium protein, unknown function [Plasmodium knowlesi |eukprot:XP_002259336.1 hypothetical protein, conserved in Plasmodium species [Plasmodium knowlesi strain H]